jgi:hypothetical protein
MYIANSTPLVLNRINTVKNRYGTRIWLLVLWMAIFIWGQWEAPIYAEDLQPSASSPISDQDSTGLTAQDPHLSSQSSGFFPSMGRRMFSRLTLNGYLRNETAFRINKPSALTKILNIANFEPRYSFGNVGLLSSRVRCYYDSVYDFEDVDTISPRRGPASILADNPSIQQIQSMTGDNVRNVQYQQNECDLKELYLDSHFPRLDLRLGKQIVRWGVVEGARVTDEINPLDLGEFILRDIEDRYIPLWMVKNDIYFGQNTLEMIWIPDLKFNKPAPRESEWEQFRLLDGLVKPDPPTESLNNIGNSEWALKFSFLAGGWDMAVSYFYTWDDFPAAFRTLNTLGTFAALPTSTTVNFTPHYERLRIPGITLSKSLGKAVFNAEAAYVDGKVFGQRVGSFTIPNTSVQGVVIGEAQRDYVKYAVGIDTTLWGVDLSGQILQQYILDYQPDIIQDEIDTVVGFFIRKTLLSNALTAQALNLYFINDNEWLVRPRLGYNFTDQVKLSFGADILLGTISDVAPNGVALPGEFHFVGFFKNNSRVYTEIQYSF